MFAEYFLSKSLNEILSWWTIWEYVPRIEDIQGIKCPLEYLHGLDFTLGPT